MGTRNEIKVRIEQYPKNYKKMIYLAGRNCYGLEDIGDSVTESDMDRFIAKIIANGHDSVLEHCHVSVYLKNVSRSFMAQITRHRLCSFSIKSQHFVKHSNFLYRDVGYPDKLQKRYERLMADINKFYGDCIKGGIACFNAREILPNSCLTNIFMTANIREWRYIISMRITKNNTPEMIEIMKSILVNMYLLMPEFFVDMRDKYLPERPDMESEKWT